MDIETKELLARYLPRVKDLRPGFDGCASGYSNMKAHTILGFEPRW
jgi:hypothetical protein